MIKSGLTTFLILSFFGVAVLGALAMDPMSDHSHQNGCIASLANGFNCPNETGSFGFAYFHIDAFKSFSSATLSGGFAVFLTVLSTVLAGLIGFGVFFLEPDLSPQLSLTSRFRYFLESAPFSSQRRVLRWLALHENSPANRISRLRLPEKNW